MANPRSTASIAGHPIHPMLIPFPIASFLGALVADIIYLATDNLFWYDVAYVATGTGVVFALLAALAGLFVGRPPAGPFR